MLTTVVPYGVGCAFVKLPMNQLSNSSKGPVNGMSMDLLESEM
jgi:hypothetical protein